MTDHERILLVGCGKMGSALLNGWLTRGTPSGSVSVVEPMQPQLPRGVSGYPAAAALDADYRPSVVVFAVKPQSMDEVVPAYAEYAHNPSQSVDVVDHTSCKREEGPSCLGRTIVSECL